jgi:hypothetical protein
MNRGPPTDEKCQLISYPLEPFIRWREIFEEDIYHEKNQLTCFSYHLELLPADG